MRNNKVNIYILRIDGALVRRTYDRLLVIDRLTTTIDTTTTDYYDCDYFDYDYYDYDYARKNYPPRPPTFPTGRWSMSPCNSRRIARFFARAVRVATLPSGQPLTPMFVSPRHARAPDEINFGFYRWFGCEPAYIRTPLIDVLNVKISPCFRETMLTRTVGSSNA